jgi:hypothetical protein
MLVVRMPIEAGKELALEKRIETNTPGVGAFNFNVAAGFAAYLMGLPRKPSGERETLATACTSANPHAPGDERAPGIEVALGPGIRND